jgi:hypothetical protein
VSIILNIFTTPLSPNLGWLGTRPFIKLQLVEDILDGFESRTWHPWLIQGI